MKTPPVCDYEGSDYQSSFWDTGERRYEDLAEAIALEHLLPSGGSLMLELGAGAGRNTPRYKNYKQIVVLDYSTTQLSQARERLGESAKYIFVAADIYKLPFKNGLFDGATMIRTLHHMREPKLALAQVERCLTPGAVFILEFANKLNLKAILRYVLGKQKWSPFSRDQVEFVELNFDFHPKSVRQITDELGFTTKNTRTVSHFRVGVLKKLFPAKLLAAVDGFIQPTGNWWQLAPSVFTRLEKNGSAPLASEALANPMDLFQCPECGGDLAESDGAVKCQGCGATYAYENGIYDLRKPL